MSDQRVTNVFLVCVTLAYPFLVFLGLQHVSPRVFAGALVVMWLVRLLVARNQRGSTTAWLGIASMAFAAWAWLGGRGDQLRWYPVVCSGVLLATFLLSLYRGRPVAERVARLREPQLSPRAVWYTRRVTQAWCVFFAANGLVATATALWGSLFVWSLYNGFISYVLMGLMFAVEYGVRVRFRRGEPT